MSWLSFLSIVEVPETVIKKDPQLLIEIRIFDKKKLNSVNLSFKKMIISFLDEITWFNKSNLIKVVKFDEEDKLDEEDEEDELDELDNSSLDDLSDELPDELAKGICPNLEEHEEIHKSSAICCKHQRLGKITLEGSRATTSFNSFDVAKWMFIFATLGMFFSTETDFYSGLSFGSAIFMSTLMF